MPEEPATPHARTSCRRFSPRCGYPRKGVIDNRLRRAGWEAHSRRLARASAPPRVFASRAVARASGVNNPASQSAPPLRQSPPGRRNHTKVRPLAQGAVKRARTRTCPWAPSFGATRKTGRRWPLKPPRLLGSARASVRLCHFSKWMQLKAGREHPFYRSGCKR
jgi:hypothetical protein